MGLPRRVVIAMEESFEGNAFVELSDDERAVFDVLNWHEFAEPEKLTQAENLRRDFQEYPQDYRVLPTRLGNILRATEDELYEWRSQHSAREDKFASREMEYLDKWMAWLDTYCSAIVISAILALIAPLILRDLGWLVSALSAACFLFLAVVSYAGALHSARSYAAALRALSWRHEPAVRLPDASRARSQPSFEFPLEKEQTLDGSTEVFIVHGHEGEAKHHVARVVQALTQRRPVILHEQASGGKTIIEKLEAAAKSAACAVVLLTPDDFGGVAGRSGAMPRARQNVVFEFGYFAGILGRGNVIALTKGGVELPSDLHGIVYIDMDKADWQSELGRELKGIEGLEVDMNNLGM